MLSAVRTRSGTARADDRRARFGAWPEVDAKLAKHALCRASAGYAEPCPFQPGSNPYRAVLGISGDAHCQPRVYFPWLMKAHGLFICYYPVVTIRTRNNAYAVLALLSFLFLFSLLRFFLCHFHLIDHRFFHLLDPRFMVLT